MVSERVLASVQSFCFQDDTSFFFCCSISSSECCSVVSNSFNPMDYTVHGILQAKILEWAAMSSSRRSSQPRDRNQVSCIAGGFFISWATKEAHSTIISLNFKVPFTLVFNLLEINFYKEHKVRIKFCFLIFSHLQWS